MSTIGVAKYASVSTSEGRRRSAASGSSVARPARRRFHASHADQPMTASAHQSTTWSLASQKRSVANALKQTTFCQSGRRRPLEVGSRYMCGSHTYCRR